MHLELNEWYLEEREHEFFFHFNYISIIKEDKVILFSTITYALPSKFPDNLPKIKIIARLSTEPHKFLKIK